MEFDGSPSQKTLPTLSFNKKLVFYFLLLLFTYIFTEILSYGAYRLLYGQFSFSQNQSERAQIISPVAKNAGPLYGGDRRNWNVLHPYYGFVTEGVDPNIQCKDTTNCDRRARTYEDLPFVQSNADNLIVGILGGSFAHGVSYATESIKHTLARIPRFKGKEIHLYHMAVGGYKQPQQLLKFNYFLALGAQFDIVINIDGFNEIAIPGTENLTKGVNPFFPRSWYYYVDGALNEDLLVLYGIRASAKTQQKAYASFFSSSPIRYTFSANLLWAVLNRNIANKMKNTDVALIEYKGADSRKRHYVTTGPDYSFQESSESFYQNMAEFWARCSLLIYNQCLELDIEYYHFLQPNQYVTGSKPMSDVEKSIAFSDRSLYGKAAAEGYPYLIEQGKALQTQGVPYHDLTMLFSQTRKDLYIDDCCHLNMPGYTLVAQEIFNTIANSHPPVIQE